MNGISVILPTYKEYENLKILIPSLVDMFEKFKIKYEIVVVDDNSGDGTDKLINNFISEGGRINFINRINESGLASAIIRGTDAATFDTIVHMDSDLAHRVDDLKKMLIIYMEANQDNLLLIGSRYHKDSLYKGKPFLNRLASSVGRYFVKLYLRTDIVDPSNNFRIFSKNGWKKIRYRLIEEGNIMIVQIAYLLQKEGYEVKDESITYIERELGNTKLNILQETKSFFRQLNTVKKSIESRL